MKIKFKKTLPFFVFLSIISFLFVLPIVVQAQEMNELMENLIANTPLIRADLLSIIFQVIQYALGFLGVLAVVILIYGGFVWMTAAGNEEKVQKAKKIIINGLIGLVVILLSYAIVSFVIGPLLGIGRDDTLPLGRDRGGPGGYPDGARYLVITDRKPKQGETIFRNTIIQIYFNQALDLNSVRLARPDKDDPTKTTCLDENNNPDWTAAIQDKDNRFIDGSLSVMGNSLVFAPLSDCPEPLDTFPCEEKEGEICSLKFKEDGCCGCFEQGTNYKITLIARRRIGERTKEGLKGLRNFGNTMRQDETWTFNVSAYTDDQAPIVKTNLPQGNRVARNIGILVEFDKPINPLTLKLYNPRCVPGSVNCNVNNCNTEECLGYAVDNLNDASVRVYKIEEGEKVGIAGFFERFSTTAFIFRPNTRCDEDPESYLYYCRCLPPVTQIHVELDEEKIRGGNCVSLDCANDRCSWNFTTSNEIDLDPPEIIKTFPKDKEEEIDRLLKEGIQGIFNEDMDPTSINEDTFVVYRPKILTREVAVDCSESPPCTDRASFYPARILEPNIWYLPLVYGGGRPGDNSCNLDPVFASGVRDLAGNVMIGNHTWNFKTSWQVNAGQPWIERVSPGQGPKGDCVTVIGYNLGCCGPYNDECDEKEAQKKEFVARTRECSETGRIPGRAEFCSEGDETGKCLNYVGAEVLEWDEINRPSVCVPGDPNKNCPKDCTTETCPADCSECMLCSGSDEKCKERFKNNEIKECWCRIQNYSPKNQLVIVVPEGAENRSLTDPGEIRVVPAQ